MGKMEENGWNEGDITYLEKLVSEEFSINFKKDTH